MAFSPKEIEEKDFLVTLRGYDKEEVKAFLQALAADYAEALKAAGNTSGGPSYKAWGREMADLLQQAHEAAERITRKASEEAGAARARAEDEAGRLREAARNAGARLTEDAERHATELRSEAERYAREVRASADTEAEQRLAEANGRVQELQDTENKIRERLQSLESILGSMRTTLQPDEAEVIDLSQAATVGGAEEDSLARKDTAGTSGEGSDERISGP